MSCQFDVKQFQDDDNYVLPKADFQFDVNLSFDSNVMKQASEGYAKIWMVPVSHIHVKEDFNVRILGKRHEEQIESIKNSILSEGFHIHEPLGVFIEQQSDGSNKVFVHHGHTRLAAVHKARSEGANIEIVPCVPIPRGYNRDQLIASLVTSNTGRPLTPLERAVVIKRLFSYGHKISAISELLNLKAPTIDRSLKVMEAPSELHHLIAQEKIAFTRAAEILEEYGTQKAMEVIRKHIAATNGTIRKRAAPPVMQKNKFKNLAMKEAPHMVRTFSEITLDPGWDYLSEEIKDRIQSHLKLLEASEAANNH